MAAPASRITMRQKALIGVLGAILIGVLFFPGTSTTQTASQSEQSPVPRRRSGQDQSASARDAEKPIRWPKFALEDVLSKNPFVAFEDREEAAGEITEAESLAAVGAAATEASPEPTEVGDVTRLRVSVVIRGPQGPAAVIGDRIVHEGDIVDGCRIVSISNSGVIAVPVTDQ